MSSSKADSEVQVGAELGFGKRCALISVSVLLTMAGALSYRHAVSAGVGAGEGQRGLQGRRLPHYTTYGGTSYDFASFQPLRPPTNDVSGQVVNMAPFRPPTNDVSGQVVNMAAKISPCCCLEGPAAEKVQLKDEMACEATYYKGRELTKLKGITMEEVCCCSKEAVLLTQPACKLTIDDR